MSKLEQNLSDTAQRAAIVNEYCLQISNLNVEPQTYVRHDVSSLADAIYDCESIEELCRYVKWAAAIFGSSKFSLQVISERSLLGYNHRLVTNYSASFVSRYLDKNYYFVDPIAQKCRSHQGLFFWKQVLGGSPTTEHYLAEAASYAIGPNGKTFVSNNCFGDTCAFSVSLGSISNKFFRDKVTVNNDFCYLSKLIIDVFTELSCMNCSGSFNLTNDQIRVLHQIAHGKDESELKKQEYLYGSFYNIKSSILRLCGAKTLAQAAILAEKRGLLEEVPYTRQDPNDILLLGD